MEGKLVLLDTLDRLGGLATLRSIAAISGISEGSCKNFLGQLLHEGRISKFPGTGKPCSRAGIAKVQWIPTIYKVNPL